MSEKSELSKIVAASKGKSEEIHREIIVEPVVEGPVPEKPVVQKITKEQARDLYNPAVYEWVVWFKDGTLLSQYDVNGVARKYQHVTIYAEQISPIKRVGWLPISPKKRQKVNYLAKKSVVESVNINVVFVEVHNDEEVFLRKRHAITIPLSAGGPPVRIDTFYICGAGNRFIAIDSGGNIRLDNHSNITVPVIPPEAADQRMTPEIVEEVYITGGEEPAAA